MEDNKDLRIDMRHNGKRVFKKKGVYCIYTFFNPYSISSTIESKTRSNIGIRKRGSIQLPLPSLEMPTHKISFYK